MTSIARKKIAVIGSGISGLLSAYLLSRHHDVHVFEANDYVGGHTATKTVSLATGDYNVDTGFIVFNDRTYPHFMKLLDELGVEYQPTEMGFSVSCQRTGIEYSGTSFNGLFAQRKNLLNIRHWKMLFEILRFNKACTHLHTTNTIPEAMTLGDYLREHNYSDEFQQLYILPMVSAIWSSGLGISAAMPLVFFIRFFHNHGLLTVTNQPQWYTIRGGSKSYVAPLTRSFDGKLFTRCPVEWVKRTDVGVVVYTPRFAEQTFDEVIFACHSDQALALLADATEKEQEILSAIPYTKNSVVLHSDTRLLPRSERAWASWNYLLLLSKGDADSAALTYNMNILQNINAPVTFCVTVNASESVDPEKVYGRYTYNHPLFTTDSVAAQARWHEISGHNNTHFCGAYWRNGFHEDGVFSAIRVAETLGEVW